MFKPFLYYYTERNKSIVMSIEFGTKKKDDTQSDVRWKLRWAVQVFKKKGLRLEWFAWENQQLFL